MEDHEKIIAGAFGILTTISLVRMHRKNKKLISCLDNLVKANLVMGCYIQKLATDEVFEDIANRYND